MKLSCRRMQTTWGGALLSLAIWLFPAVAAHAQAGGPSVTTGAASSLTTTTATLNGTVNPNGVTTTVTFEYGLTGSYGSSVPATLAPVSGSNTIAVSAPLTGLSAETTYHFRIKGVSGGGSGNGSDATFSTASVRRVPNQLLATLNAPSAGVQTTGNLGLSVAVDGNYTAVGVPSDDTGATDSGIVKVFNTANGTLLFTIPNPTPASGDQFGSAVAISGNYLVVGDALDDTGATDSGSAFVYDLSSVKPTVPQFILNNPGPATSDAFGFSVAISGNRVVVGARLDDTGAANSGSVYVYDISTSTPTVPLVTLNNPGPAVDDEFGYSVAISGSLLVVGARQDDTNASNAGSAYVYDLSSGAPSVAALVLNKPTPAVDDFFGFSVAISGTKIVVGAYAEDTGANEAGSVYVYDWNSGTPTVPIYTLNNPAPALGDWFGHSVAISGTKLLIGARLDDAGAANSGSAYLYDISSGTPTTPLYTFNNPTPAASDVFGTSVAISGDNVAIGAPFDDTGASDAGSAYLYSLTSGTPATPSFTLNSPGPATDDRFGSSVSVSGVYTVVGSPRDDVGASNAGSVYVYDSSIGTPTAPVLTINNPSPTADDNFGAAVAIHGSRVAVGAPFDDASATNSGSVYVYDLSSGTPTAPVLTLANPVPGANDNFGNSVALFGTLLVVGASEDDTSGTDTGSAYVYDLASATPGTPVYTFNNPSPASGDDSFGSTVAVSGRRIVVAAVSDDQGATDAGSVYVYDLDSGTPTTPIAEIFNPSPAATDFFGYHVAISGTRVVVGALGDDTVATDSGAAYVYDMASGTPTVPVYTLNNPTPVAGDNFGHSVAIAGNWVVVAASNDGTGGTGSGSFYFYDLAGMDPTLPVQMLSNPFPNANDDFGIMMAMDGAHFAVAAPFDDTIANDKGAVYLYGPSSGPEISVELLNGGVLEDGSSAVNFGYTPVGAGTQRIVVIKNLGGAPLTGLSLSKDGANAGDFALSSPGSTTLAPGASTTFTITFSPSAAAADLAALHITSNDADESPFDIALTGSGMAGSADPKFDAQIVGGTVMTSLELPSGKILIGGDFLTVGGQSQPNLARLNSDGTVDTSFAPVTSGTVYCLALQSDGKILVGGSFTITGGGQSRSGLARLNADGTLDPSLPILSVNNQVSAVAVQSDGKIVLGGFFTSILGQSRSCLARLNTDGTLDSGYTPNPSASVDAMALQSDGKLVIGGQFATVGGATRNRLARVNTDGTYDAGFDPNVSSWVRAIVVQSDGKITFSGNFTTVGGTTRNRVARVNADGTLDTGFNPNVAVTTYVYALALQGDGKIVIGGAFTSVGGSVSRANIARLLSDGGCDMSFNPGCDGPVRCTTVLTDGRILIGGRFARVGGQARNLVAILGSDGTPAVSTAPDIRGGIGTYALSVQPDGKVIVGGGLIGTAEQTQIGLTRLLGDGRLDTSFTSSQILEFLTYTTVAQGDGKLIFNRGNGSVRTTVTGSIDGTFTSLSANNPVYCLAMQADGKVLVGGGYTTFGGQTRNNLARVNADGTLDTGFNPNVNNTVYSLAVQPDGKIVIGGVFTTVGGTTRNRIARLNADGTLDTGFDPNANSTVFALALQPDGKILAGGFFGALNNITRNRLARLNPDGTPDSFNPAPNNTVFAIALQANGQIVVGGDFTSIAGDVRNRIARVNADGTLDTAFNADIDSSVLTIALTSEGQVLAGGRFSRVSGASRSSLAQLTNTPAMQSLTANSAGTTVTWTRTGTSPEVDRVTFESSVDAGTTWSSLGSGARTTNGWQLTGQTLPSGQSYRIRARGWQMTGGYYGGDSSVYETVALMPASGAPEIVIEQPSGTSLTDGASTVSFGGASLSAAADRTFVIRNTGTADLTGLALTVDGAHASDFTLLVTPDPVVNAGGSATFTVRFTPGAPGARYANIHVYSNDADESPFDIALSGAGQAGSGLTSVANIVGGFVSAFARQPDGKLWVAGNFDQIGGGVRTDLARLNSDGTLDTAMDLGSFSSSVEALLFQADGKLLYGGTFSGPNGSVLRRLNANGTHDTSFLPSGNSTVQALGQQSDGKLIVAGSFTSFGGQPRNRICRLNLDGSLDTSFNPDANNNIEALVVQATDKIVIVGSFTTIGGTTRNRIARLNADGTLDTGFDPNANSTINAVIAQADGKLLLGGFFTTIAGGSRNRVARLTSEGALDSGFTDPNVNNAVNAVHLQSDGKIVIGGTLTTVAGETHNMLARLNSDGTLDSSFNADVNGTVSALIGNPNGSLMAGGAFTTVGGVTRNRLAQIQTNGSLDASVNPDVNGAFIFATVQQADGKTLVGGWFTHVNNVPRSMIARLNADGSLDTNFNPGTNGEVYSVACQPDGNILVGGLFTFAGGATRNYIARFYPNGTLDSSFNPNANNYVYALTVEPAGTILMGGLFTTVSGTTRNRIARLNADGTLNTGFDPNANSSVYGLTVQPDGKILAGGVFTSIGGGTHNFLARLNTDGTHDAGFTPNFNSTVYGVQLEPDGRMVAHGVFTTVSSVSRPYVARLNGDGTLATAFDPSPNAMVTSLSRQVNGSMVAGGLFTSITKTGIASTRNRLALLGSDGRVSGSFNPDANFSIYALAGTAQGQVLAGGLLSALGGTPSPKLVRLNTDSFTQALGSNASGTTVTWVRTGSSPEVDRVTFEGSADGATWSSLGNGTRSAAGWQLTGLSLPSGQDYFLRARGYQMTGGFYGGDGSVYETLEKISLAAASVPEIAVEQPVNTDLTSGVSQISFGSVATGSSADRTFTIRNTGSASLTGLAVSLSGSQAADYLVTTAVDAAVAAGATTTFTVRFTPSNSGTRTAVLSIWSNDADEYPFTVNLTGAGLGSPPSATTLAATIWSSTAATLNGSVSDNGAATTISFDYGLTTSYGSNVAATPASLTGGASSTVSALLSGLTANTTYHFRVRAVSSAGTALGSDMTVVMPVFTAGEVDVTFNLGANNAVFGNAVQPDGKILIGGSFTTVGATTRNSIARLNADGTLDTGFNPDVVSGINCIMVQPDGKILIGGGFTTVGGVTRNRIARLNADGSLDTSFNPNSNGTVSALASYADGRILVAGSFTTMGGVARNRVARLNADGSLDTGFNPNASSTVNTAVLQSDGKIVIGGAFTTVGGQTRNRIARLNADGTTDSSFDPNADNIVNSLVVQRDGKIVAGGQFATMGGVSNLRVARLNTDGSLDTGFAAGSVNSTVFSLNVQADGKILVAGQFTTVNSVSRNRLARLNVDGSLDTSFNPNANNVVYSLAQQPDGQVVAVGFFTSMGGYPLNNVARVKNDAATQALSAASYTRVQWLRGGAAPEVDGVTFELSTDGGTTRTQLGTATRITGGWELTGVNLPSSGQIRARGRTMSGYQNGSSGLLETTQSYSGLAAPEISVFNGAGTSAGNARTDNVGVANFTATGVGSTSASQTFTIQNVGTANLTGLSVNLVMPGDFTFTQPAATTLAPGAFTTFTVSFAPTAVGTRTATLLVVSNDYDENPFEIGLQGSGTGTLKDNYANRISLGNAATVDVSGTNVGATVEVGENTFGGVVGATVWAEWTAPSTGWFTLHTAGSKLDTVIGLFTGGGTVQTLQLMGFNDESSDQSDLNFFGNAYGISRLVFYAQVNTTYTVGVGGWNNGSGVSTGSYQLHLAAIPPPAVRVMGVSFNPTSVDVTTSDQVTDMQISVDSDSPLFPDGVLTATVNRLGVGYNGIVAFFDAADRVSGTDLSGTYLRDIGVSRYVMGGVWSADIRAYLGGNYYHWSTIGDDLQEDNFLIPAATGTPLPVINSGPVDSEPPMLVSLTGFPASVDVTSGDATFDVDVAFTDDLAGFSSLDFHVSNEFGRSYSLNTSIPGTLISGDWHSGVFRQTVTIPQSFGSGIYYPEVALRDAVNNFAEYSDNPTSADYLARISAPEDPDLQFEVIGSDPDIEVQAPDMTLLQTGVGAVDLGQSGSAIAKANYNFSGTLLDEFVPFENSGAGTVTQTGGVLSYSTGTTPEAYSSAIFIHKNFHPRYDQSWSAEATVKLPASLDANLPPGSSPYMDNGLVVSFTCSDGRIYHVHASLSLEPGRKYMSYYAMTDTDGTDYELGNGHDVSTSDESGVVRLKFDAATKILSAETYNNTLFRLNLASAGWGMAATDTFDISTEFTVSECFVPPATPITLDDFRAALIFPAATQSFTITNTGAGFLNGLGIYKDGNNATDFTVGPLEANALYPGESTTFEVSFVPTGAGMRTAAMHILSTDPDENPFDINLTGSGGAGPPTALTLSATNITRTGASLNGSVNASGSDTTVVFEYGLTTSYGWTVTAAPSPVTGTTDAAVTKLLTGLTPGTTFHYRVRASNAQGSADGEDKTFSTPLTTAGTVSSAFIQGTTNEGRAIAVQPDGKALIGGGDNALGASTVPALFRVNTNGTVDSTFAAVIGGNVSGIAVQADKKIVICGAFSKVGGVTRNGLARLNSNGTLDASFAPGGLTNVNAVLMQADGKILVCGGSASGLVARLNADGTTDASFAPVVNARVHGMALQAGGKIVIVGDFSSVNAQARNWIARLNADGTLDSSFVDPNANAGARFVTAQSNGKLVVGGLFTSVGGIPCTGFARLNADGTVDPSFYTALGTPNAVALQADGRMIVAAHLFVSSLTASGSPDTFTQQLDKDAYGVALDSNGKVLVTGNFNTIGGVARKTTARLANDTATQALTVTPAGGILWSRGGTSAEAQWVTFEVSTDGGGSWSSVGNGSAVSGGWQLNGATLPASGVLRARAGIASSQGSSGLAEATANFTIPFPEIAVFNGASTAVANERADNVGVFAFGPLLLGSSATRTFTLRNVGTATLTGIGATLSGTGEFTLASPGVTSLAAGASTTLTVTFFPTATGLQTCTVSLTSNDADENPFEIQISGHCQVPPAITTNPASLFLGLGQAGALNVSGTGTALEYQWLHNGQVVPGETAPILSIAKASLGHAGVWSARVFNGVGSVTSQVANVGVVDTQTATKSVQAGDTLTLLLSAACPGGSYRWFKNGVAVSRGINPETKLVIANIRSDQAGAYTCQVTMTDPANAVTPLMMQSGAVSVDVTTGSSGSLAIRKERPVLLPFEAGPWMVGGEVDAKVRAQYQPTHFSITGLPAGVKLDAVTGQLTGAPTVALTAPKRYPLTITASNAAGACLVPLHTEVLVQPLPGYTTGTFAALVSRNGTLNDELGGRVALTIDTAGSYTGTLVLAKGSLAIAGRVTNVVIGQDVGAEVVIKRGGKLAPLTLAFVINRLTGELKGTLSDGAEETTVGGWRDRGTGADVAGVSSVELVGADAPAPVGHLQVTVKASGGCLWAGGLPDGTKITGSAALGLAGSVPVQNFLYGQTGSLQGWIGTGPVSGKADWLRKAGAGSPGFGVRELEVR